MILGHFCSGTYPLKTNGIALGSKFLSRLVSSIDCHLVYVLRADFFTCEYASVQMKEKMLKFIYFIFFAAKLPFFCSKFKCKFPDTNPGCFYDIFTVAIMAIVIVNAICIKFNTEYNVKGSCHFFGLMPPVLWLLSGTAVFKFFKILAMFAKPYGCWWPVDLSLYDTLSALDWVTQRDRLVIWNSDISRFLGLPRFRKSQTRCQGESPSTMGQSTNTLHAKEGEGSILSSHSHIYTCKVTEY